MKTSRADLQQQTGGQSPASRKRLQRPPLADHSLGKGGPRAVAGCGPSCTLRSRGPMQQKPLGASWHFSDLQITPAALEGLQRPARPWLSARPCPLHGARRHAASAGKVGCNVLAGPRPLWPRALRACRLTDKGGPVRGRAHRCGCGGEACRGEQSEHDESTVPGHARDLWLGAQRPLCLPGPASCAKSDCPRRAGHRLIGGGCSREPAESSLPGPR